MRFALPLRSPTSWMVCLAGIVAMGILSRVVHTGLVIFDKYLGDALYAAMVYSILRIFWRRRTAGAVAVAALVVMTAIELFQLTGIPARLMGSEYLVVRICARLMGTEFSFLDLVAYGVGIGCLLVVDASSGE